MGRVHSCSRRLRALSVHLDFLVSQRQLRKFTSVHDARARGFSRFPVHTEHVQTSPTGDSAVTSPHEKQSSLCSGQDEVLWLMCSRMPRQDSRIVGNPVPPDETQTAQDEPERHEVVRILFECSSGERTPDVLRFSSDRVTIRPQRPVREVLVQASVRGIHTASPARSRFP